MKLSGAKILVECLKAIGTKRVYGVIGTSVLGFIDALYDEKNEIRYISTRHEQVAGSMADVEGRITGNSGVVVTHSGPGTLNVGISLAIAYKDCSPVISISGSVSRRIKGSDGMLEIDHEGIFKYICKGAFSVKNASSIPNIFSLAYNTAMDKAKGPVLIEIPEDVWGEEAEFESKNLNIKSEQIIRPQKDEIHKCIEILKSARKPVILAGGGANTKKGSIMITSLIDTYKLPIITTGNGRGVMSEENELCFGRVGFGGGNPVADYTLENSDVILVIAAGVSDMTTYHYTMPISGKLIIVNIDREYISKSRLSPHLFIESNAVEFVSSLLNELGLTRFNIDEWVNDLKSRRRDWEGQLTMIRNIEKEPISPSPVLYKLSKHLPKNAIVVGGQGMHLQYINCHIPCYEPKTYFAAGNFGAMGFGLPGAMGAKVVCPDREVVAILGDGEFMMTLQDIETAVREGIKIKIFIINDSSYRVLRMTQQMNFFGRIYGVEHSNPDFVKLAESFSAQGYRIKSPNEIDDKLNEIFKTEGLAIVDVPIDKDDIAPANFEAIMRMRRGL